MRHFALLAAVATLAACGASGTGSSGPAPGEAQLQPRTEVRTPVSNDLPQPVAVDAPRYAHDRLLVRLPAGVDIAGDGLPESKALRRLAARTGAVSYSWILPRRERARSNPWVLAGLDRVARIDFAGDRVDLPELPSSGRDAP